MEYSFDRAVWPNEGRVGLCRRSSNTAGSPTAGNYILVVPDNPGMWMVYEIGPNGEDPRSDLFSQESIPDFVREGDVHWFEGAEEKMLEQKLFRVRIARKTNGRIRRLVNTLANAISRHPPSQP